MSFVPSFLFLFTAHGLQLHTNISENIKNFNPHSEIWKIYSSLRHKSYKAEHQKSELALLNVKLHKAKLFLSVTYAASTVPAGSQSLFLQTAARLCAPWQSEGGPVVSEFKISQGPRGCHEMTSSLLDVLFALLRQM